MIGGFFYIAEIDEYTVETNDGQDEFDVYRPIVRCYSKPDGYRVLGKKHHAHEDAEAEGKAIVDKLNAACSAVITELVGYVAPKQIEVNAESAQTAADALSALNLQLQHLQARLNNLVSSIAPDLVGAIETTKKQLADTEGQARTMALSEYALSGVKSFSGGVLSVRKTDSAVIEDNKAAVAWASQNSPIDITVSKDLLDRVVKKGLSVDGVVVASKVTAVVSYK